MSAIVGRAIGLFLLCLVMGLLLDAIGVSARGLLYDTWHTLSGMFRRIGEFFEWAVPYVALGAIIVVPLYIVRLIDHRRRGQRRG